MERQNYDSRIRTTDGLGQNALAKIVASIWDDLDGQEWSPDTLDSIAETLRSYGLPVGSPEEYAVPE